METGNRQGVWEGYSGSKSGRKWEAGHMDAYGIMVFSSSMQPNSYLLCVPASEAGGIHASEVM